MNKTLYRVIFNRKRGCMMVVAETTKREGKSCADTDSGSVHVKSVPVDITRSRAFSISLLGFSLFLALGTASISHAQGIVADKHAPKTQQATILQTGNGTPQINIQTPTSAGVSVNQYQQFDVNGKGAILNNSRANVQTQLGGWIQGNPWLATGEARVIVNQINSSNPSQLNGYIEVGGKRAEVVMANPAGIAVNGGGFINASRATLATGTPQYQAGALTGFHVRSGEVAIHGQGLDTRDTDYTRILSYHTKVNAPIWGKDVRVVAGQNDVAATGDEHTVVSHAPTGSASQTSPVFAIDTGALGGMYANKITLISTAEQAGIRNQGQLFATAGNVAIDAKGQLVNSGTIAATNAQDANNSGEHKVNIRSQTIENSGTIASQQRTQIQSQSIQNTGTVLSSGELDIHNSGSLKNETSGHIQAARLAVYTDTLDNQGTIAQTGSQKLHIQANGQLSNSGKIGLPDTTPTASNGSSNHTGNNHNTPANSSTIAPTTATGTGSATISTSSTTNAPTFADGAIHTRGALNNSGSISANGQVDITAQQDLHNTGQMAIHQLNAKGSAFNNHNGTILSDKAHIQTNSLNNQNGNITTRQQLAIETAQLNNANGQLLSAGKADLAVSGSLNNTQKAEIQAKQLNLDVGHLDNAGHIFGEGSSRIASQNSLRNSGNIAVGQLITKGQILDNTQGQIAVDKADIQSQQLLNQNGNITTTKQLTVHSQKVENQQGKLLSVENAQFTVSGSLNNQNGEIATNQQLTINDGQQYTLAIDNTNGKIQSGRDVSIQAKSLSNNGTLAADNKLDIALKDDFQVERNIMAGNELLLSTQGSLKNSHTLQAGKHIQIQANSIDNAAQGSIQSSGTTDMTVQQNLVNRGLIDGRQTKIQAGQVNNIGTGRIYGDNIAIAATRLDNQNENGTGATIAAREDLNLGIHQLNNRENSLIYSGKDMAIGGALDAQGQAIGKAKIIRNASATIESAGKMRLGVETLRNTNEHLQTQLVETGREHIVDYEAFGRHELLREGTQHELGWFIYNDESDHLRTPDGATHEKWHKYDYEKVTQETQVTQTAPAKIISGSDLTIDGKEVFNIDSQIIAGGNLLVQTDKDGLHNEQTFGEKKVFSENGKLHNYWRARRRGRDRTGYSEQNYTLPEEITRNISLGSFAYESHSKALSHQAPNQGTALPQSNWNHIRTTQSNGISLPNTSSPFAQLPSSSLYTINPTNKGYLVETDPRFANYRQWLGSDYMLGSLKLDPNNLHKRLGDGYYEQRLINEQITELTGHRRLDGYQNDEEQFKALMDNGATAARSMNLTVGIALSAEQIAQLTSDIVWLVHKEVKLPDGSTQTVLVPQVYVRVKNGDIDGKGALLSGSNAQIDVAGNLKNSGTIAGRNALIINTDTLDNIGGHVHAQKAAISATQDINNIGGTLSAGNALILQAGNNINSQSTTASSQNTQGSSTHLDRIAGIYITGTEKGVLAAQAGKDINIIASQISNQSEQGQTQLQAGRNINLDTVQTSKHQATHFDADNHVIRGSTHEIGSSIQTQGDVTLLAGNNLNAKAAEVSSANGALAVSAKNDINISAGINTTQVDDASKHKGRSGGGKKLVITDKVQSRNETAQSSTFDGKQVVLQAGNDANIKGSNVISDKGTSIQAQNNINLLATEANNSHQTYHHLKKSGFTASFNSGILSVGYTRAQTANSGEDKYTTVNGSQIGSIHGNTQILAGKQIKTEAASIGSGQDILMQAQDINIGAAYEHKKQQHTTQSRSKGFNINVNLIAPELRQLQKRYEGIQQAAQQDNELKRNQAWHNGSIAANTEQFKPAVTFSASSQRSNSQALNQSSQAIGSSINAGGKAYIQASKGDVNIVGSQVFAQQGLVIDSQRDINIIGTEEYLNTQSQSRSRTSGTNDSGQFSVFMGNQTHTQEQQKHQITHSDSIVGSGTGQTQIHAGKTYTQTGSQVLSGSHIDIQAQNIDIHAADNPYSSHTRQTFTQKGLTAGVSSPLIEAIKTAQAANESLNQVGQSKNTRTNVMAAANAGWQTYQAAQTLSRLNTPSGSTQAANGKSAGGNKGTGISINITYGEQRNQSQSHIQGNEAQGARILADGKVTLTATGKGKDSDIRIHGADIAGKQGTHLVADDQIHITAAQQDHSERSNNSQRGWNAGVALDFSNGFSLGFTAGGNYGKGYGNGDSITHHHSHIGDKGSQTIIQSGGDTTLKGAQVIGKGVQVNAKNLIIETPQDSAAYRSKQQNASAQVTVGYGFSASGDYSQSKINADHQSVSEQSGIYAGDDGYQINIAQHTDLKGGIITSSQSAEDKGKNRFSTATLTHSDIKNHSHYEGESFGLGASVAVSGKTLGQGEQNNPQESHLKTVADKNGTSSSIGYGNDSDSQSSVTQSGINTQNIRITDEDKQIQLTGKTAEESKADIYTNTSSETAQQHSGSLKNIFDKDRVQSELDLQRTVSQDFNRNVQAANGEINKQIDKLKQQLDKGQISQAEYDRKVSNWQQGSVLINSIAAGLGAPTDSVAGIATATLAPAVSYQIGQEFKKSNEEGSLKHILAHAVLGAVVAQSGGNNALAGALSAGGAEALAPKVAEYLYGKKGSELNAEQKETVSSIMSLVGAATGAAVGGTTTNAISGSLNAENAVENNQLTYKDALSFDNELNTCLKKQNSKQCINDIVKKYQAISDSKLADSISACANISRLQECRAIRKQHITDSKLLHNLWQNEKIGKVDDWYRLFDQTYIQADLALQSYNLETAAKYWTQSGNAKPFAEWMKDQGYTLVSGISPHFIRLPKGNTKTEVKDVENLGNRGQTQKTMSPVDGDNKPIKQPNKQAVPQEKPYLTESAKPIDGTTVKLSGDLQTQIGKFPKGTVVTVSGNTFKATLPDGSVRKGQSSKLAEQKMLPAPNIDNINFTRDKHGKLTDGKYTVEIETMKPHQYQYKAGKSIFYGQIDSEKAVLLAARYADKHNLWQGNKAKVPVKNGNIGILGNGELTNYINIYRNDNGFIHGSPGSKK